MLGRRILEGLGRFLTGAGVLILLFVAYELWGTGIHEERSQKSLRKNLGTIEQYFKNPPPKPKPGEPVVVPATPTGSAVAIIRIPKIGLDKAVVEGVGLSDLKKGPGHYPRTPLPGQKGNAAIAGHRTTYGAPFGSIDKLEHGDKIYIATKQGAFEYDVTGSVIVSPSQVSVLDNMKDNRLTLTTCNPKYSARQRLIVIAVLKGDVVPGSVVDKPKEKPKTPSTTVGPTTTIGEPAGLSGDRSGAGPAVMWGILASLVFIAIWVIGQRWRKWPTYILGTPIFLLVLFVFFENFSRFVPSNI